MYKQSTELNRSIGQCTIWSFMTHATVNIHQKTKSYQPLIRIKASIFCILAIF